MSVDVNPEHVDPPSHTPNGKFAPGNKAGRKHGAKSRERLLRNLNEEDFQALLLKEMELAKKGDKAAREFLLARYVPPIRPTLEKAKFEMDTSSLENAAASILSAIAGGQISPDVGESLMRSLNAAGNLGQMATLSQRLADLEERLSRMGRVTGEREIAPAAIEGATGDPAPRSWRDHIEDAQDAE